VWHSGGWPVIGSGGPREPSEGGSLEVQRIGMVRFPSVHRRGGGERDRASIGGRRSDWQEWSQKVVA
jgi:hypothetical protein